jgi:peptide-methionine (R)-S-oxide reductase
MDINKEQLKEKLTEEEFHVTQEKGTEAPFSNKYYKETANGVYTCKVCNNSIFSSDAKYHSDTPGLAGWPSFDQAIPGSVTYVEDTSFGMYRTEVICAKCQSHLGHVFHDMDAKTGNHFCMNSCALDLEKDN